MRSQTPWKNDTTSLQKLLSSGFQRWRGCSHKSVFLYRVFCCPDSHQFSFGTPSSCLIPALYPLYINTRIAINNHKLHLWAPFASLYPAPPAPNSFYNNEPYPGSTLLREWQRLSSSYISLLQRFKNTSDPKSETKL